MQKLQFRLLLPSFKTIYLRLKISTHMYQFSNSKNRTEQTKSFGIS